MLLKQNNQKAVKGILFTGLLTLLASCGNSSALESMVRADPKLRGDAESEAVTQANSAQNSTARVKNAPTAETSEAESKVAKEKTASNQLSKQVVADNNARETITQQQKTDSSLPDNFPASFPVYPKVELKEAKTEDEASGMLTWTSPDNSKAIADYYQAELTANDWEFTKPLKFDPKQEIARAIAVKGDRKVHLTLMQSNNSETGENSTRLSVIYQPLEQNIATSDVSLEKNPTTEKTETKSELDTQSNSSENTGARDKSSLEIAREKQQDLAIANLKNSESVSSTAGFADLENVPEQLTQPLKTVAALGILTPYTKDANVEVNKFAPNDIITRGEYARWLIAANNRYHEGDSGKKIYVVKNTEESAFKDVKPNDADFGAIQGLAEAGLVPSRLTQDSTNLLFRPDAPLTREDLVTWKVPLDTRQALPKASIEAIEESWGFQDVASIDSSAVRALYADYQNGDRSNIRRIFGFTTLFQPKKPVTRAEAAASLWYFGFQGDGVTAQEILELETDTDTDTDS